MTQLEKWAAMGLVKLSPAKWKYGQGTNLERKERKRQQHLAYLARQREKYKAAGLNWQGKPYRHLPPTFPPLERKEYLRQWRERKQRQELERKANG